MRKSLKRFAAILCAAVTMISFSGTKVEAAEFTGGYWQTYQVVSYWDNWYVPTKFDVYNRIETVGGPGRVVRARVKFNFSQYSLYKYEAKVRFIYSIDRYGKESYDTVVERRYNKTPGSYEINYLCNLGAYYIAVRPVYNISYSSGDASWDKEGMFYVMY